MDINSMEIVAINSDGSTTIRGYLPSVTKNSNYIQQDYSLSPFVKISHNDGVSSWENNDGIWTGEPPLPKVRRKHYKIMDLSASPVPCKQLVFCYLHTDAGTAVGISICSELDDFNESRGREIALGRANAALKERKSSRMIHKPEYRVLRDYGVFALSHWVADDR